MPEPLTSVRQLPKGKTEIIAIASGKGGTGKTLIAACLGYLLTKAGLRTLLIDADPGTDGLSLFLLGPHGTQQIDAFPPFSTFRGILNSFNTTSTIGLQPHSINRNLDNTDHGVEYLAVISGGRGIYGDPEGPAVPPLSETQF